MHHLQNLIKSHTNIITATPNKTVLEAKKMKQLMKKVKKNKERVKTLMKQKRPTNKASEKGQKIFLFYIKYKKLVVCKATS